MSVETDETRSLCSLNWCSKLLELFSTFVFEQLLTVDSKQSTSLLNLISKALLHALILFEVLYNIGI